MLKKIIKTDKAPAAIGPYNQAVIYESVVYCSGQIALNPESMELVGNSIEEQTRQVMQNIEQVLLQAGSSFSKVLKTTIFLDDMNDFTTVNEIYAGYFNNNSPARETVEVSKLPKNAKIEISCIAFV